MTRFSEIRSIYKFIEDVQEVYKWMLILFLNLGNWKVQRFRFLRVCKGGKGIGFVRSRWQGRSDCRTGGCFHIFEGISRYLVQQDSKKIHGSNNSFVWWIIIFSGFPAEVHAALAAALYEDKHAPLLAENQFTIAVLLDPHYSDLSYVKETKHWPPSLIISLRNFITLS